MVKRSVGGMLLAFFLACGCGGAAGGGVSLVSGTFLGTASDGVTRVAINAEPSASNSRTLDAFATDGASTSEYFTGTVNGNLFDLHSDTNDAELTGSLDRFGATANLAIGANPGLSVSGAATAGATGLFLVTLTMPSGSTAGTVAGIGSTGAQLAGTIDATPNGNSFAVTGTITAPGGSPINFSAFVTQDSTGQQHWIVSSDESVHGAGVTGSGTGFAAPVAA